MNNNGNANYNTASNGNGFAPRFSYDESNWTSSFRRKEQLFSLNRQLKQVIYYDKYHNLFYMFEKIYDLDNLYKAWIEVRKVSAWKERTQRYDEDILFNLIRLKDGLINRTLVLGTVNKFIMRERGKYRVICSYDVDTRIVIRSLIDNILLPLIKPKVIYDNSASLEGRGVEFHRKRIIVHLRKFYRKYGNKGYVLLMDFRKFFDNINHTQLKHIFSDLVKDEEVSSFINNLIDLNTFNISCFPVDIQNKLLTEPFDSVWYQLNANPDECDGSNLINIGVPIGGQLSQIAGIYYTNDLDNYIKIVLGEKYYGRYMDDLYIVHESKDHLWDLHDKICSYCKNKGIHINPKKTQVVPISRFFTILKIQYKVLDNGDIIRKPCKDTFIRERKAIKKFYKDLKSNIRSYNDIECSYKSWRGNISRYDCIKTLKSVDNLYDKYFNNLHNN